MNAQTDLELELKQVRARLEEAEETLRAIRSGEVDTIVVSGPNGNRCFSLEGAETPYRVLIEQMNEGAATLSTEGAILYCNYRFAQLAKTQAAELIGAAFHSLVDSSQSSELARLMDSARLTASRGEIRLRAIDGTFAPVQLSLSPLPDGGVGTICVVATDLQEVKRYEAELRQAQSELEQRVAERTSELVEALDALGKSNERFQQMAAHIADVFWMTSPDMRQILYVSPAYETVWGRTLESLQANPREWIDSIFPDDRENVLAIMSRLGADAPRFSIEFRIVRPDGSVRWVLDRGFQVVNSAGHAVCNTGLATDITERKQAEFALRQLQQELLDTSRRAGMAEVARYVLHNVGNVLNSVDVSVQLVIAMLHRSKAKALPKIVALLQEHETDLVAFITSHPRGRQLPQYLAQLSENLLSDRTEMLEAMASLQTQLEHLKSIVATQRRHTGAICQKDMVDLIEVLDESIHLSAVSSATPEVEIVRDFQRLPPVSIEKHKLVQILINLIQNAAFACRHSESTRPQIALRLVQDGARAALSVVDNGVGIAPENLTRIFQAGFSTRRDGHGFGLHGCALAAEEMGGALRAHSAGPGQGATFTLTFPLIAPQASP